MREKEEQLFVNAEHVFRKFGVKSVTMSDMARHLGISKKTLYNYVEDKNDLVEKSLNCEFGKKQGIIDAIVAEKLNAIDESFKISQYVTTILKSIHPSLHYDLEKYHSGVWHKHLSERNKKIYDVISNNLRKGIKEGLYRKSLNVDVIAKIYIARMDLTFDGELFPVEQISFAEVYLEMFRYHIRGIASEKGIAYLKEKLKKERKAKK